MATIKEDERQAHEQDVVNLASSLIARAIENQVSGNGDSLSESKVKPWDLPANLRGEKTYFIPVKIIWQS